MTYRTAVLDTETPFRGQRFRDGWVNLVYLAGIHLCICCIFSRQVRGNVRLLRHLVFPCRVNYVIVRRQLREKTNLGLFIYSRISLYAVSGVCLCGELEEEDFDMLSLGMVSPSNEGSIFGAPPLPLSRAAVHPRNPFLGAAHPYVLHQEKPHLLMRC